MEWQCLEITLEKNCVKCTGYSSGHVMHQINNPGTQEVNTEMCGGCTDVKQSLYFHLCSVAFHLLEKTVFFSSEKLW